MGQPYQSFQSLRSIGPDQIRITPGAYNHINKLFMHRLVALEIAPDVIPNDWETKTVNEIRRAIPHGIVLRNIPVEDNRNDRHLDIYVGVRLKNVDSRYRELIAKMIVGCRLSGNGTLSVARIDRQFKVE